jgi:PIN domain
MSDLVPYYVLLDTNIWVAERLLQSSIGSALLYALTRTKSSILLPEVVELEIAWVLPNMAERAVGRIRADLSLLRQLSGHNLTITAPSALAIEDGIKERWSELSGLLVRMPFTQDQAKSALRRVINKAPPSGENNEQFRDCCIWDAAVSMATDRIVHLLTADTAFYENRSRAGGLANALRAELMTAKKDIQIHSSLRDFLAAAESGAAEIDETAIGDAIMNAIMDQARQIAAEDVWPGTTFKLGRAHRPKISGYATPKPSLVAISFEASFDLERTTVENETESRDQATMTLKGVCSYDPTTKALSDIEIRESSKSGRSESGGWSTASTDKTTVNRQYDPGRMRLIS